MRVIHVSWDFMGFYGISWDFMGFHQDSDIWVCLNMAQNSINSQFLGILMGNIPGKSLTTNGFGVFQ
jgi:hypothetical protein